MIVMMEDFELFDPSIQRAGRQHREEVTEF